MTKVELIEILKRCLASDDAVHAHIEADASLLAYIDDDEIMAAYDAITRWYE